MRLAVAAAKLKLQPMLATPTPYSGITVYFPVGYTEEHIELLKAQFPDIRGVLNSRCFSMDLSDDNAPLNDLKVVFAWIERNLTAE
jgi:hypothetical protein